MVLKDRVASHRDLPPASCRIRPDCDKKGAHVLVEGSLVSSTYERPNGKGKKATTAKITSWSIRADVVRKLDRGEPEPEALTSGSDASSQAVEASDAPSF